MKKMVDKELVKKKIALMENMWDEISRILYETEQELDRLNSLKK